MSTRAEHQDPTPLTVNLIVITVGGEDPAESHHRTYLLFATTAPPRYDLDTTLLFHRNERLRWVLVDEPSVQAQTALWTSRQYPSTPAHQNPLTQSVPSVLWSRLKGSLTTEEVPPTPTDRLQSELDREEHTRPYVHPR
jgi:hypothetical protein